MQRMRLAEVNHRVLRPSAANYVVAAALGALIVFAGFGVVTGQASTGPTGRAKAQASGVACQHAPGLSGMLRESVVATRRGDVQVLHLDASAGPFSPNYLQASAGLPLEVQVSAGRGCTESLRFDGLDVGATPGESGATLRIAPLERGLYPFRCKLGKVVGLLVVR